MKRSFFILSLLCQLIAACRPAAEQMSTSTQPPSTPAANEVTEPAGDYLWISLIASAGQMGESEEFAISYHGGNFLTPPAPAVLVPENPFLPEVDGDYFSRPIVIFKDQNGEELLRLSLPLVFFENPLIGEVMSAQWAVYIPNDLRYACVSLAGDPSRFTGNPQWNPRRVQIAAPLRLC